MTLHLPSPRDVHDRCLCLAAQRAARVLARRFDAAFAPFGLTNGQFSLLNVVSRPDPPLVTDLARILAMDRSTVTAALKPLDRRGLVESRPDPADGRARRVAVTEAGRALLARALPVWLAEHAALDRDISGTDASELRAGLGAVAASGRR